MTEAHVERQSSAIAALQSVDVETIFDKDDFDADKYINEMFPSETSLVGLDPLIGNLKHKIRKVDNEILTAVRQQSSSGARARADLEKSKLAIEELFGKINEIRHKAEQSEVMVQEICRDIKKLDYAKKHLTHTITALRRLAMLISAVDQLQRATERQEYAEAAHLLEAVQQLAGHFQSYVQIPKVAELSGRLSTLQMSLQMNVQREFELLGTSEDKANVLLLERLKSCCMVVDALGYKARDQLVDSICRKEVGVYTQIFSATGETAAIDRTERRYAWLRKRLRAREDVWAVFPEAWRVQQHVCLLFCKTTKEQLGTILEARRPELGSNVEALLLAVKATNDFEAEMAKRFGGGEELDGLEDLSPEDLTADDASPASAVRQRYEKLFKERQRAAETGTPKGADAAAARATANLQARMAFQGIISSVFMKFLSVYVDAEERQLRETLEQLVREETWQPMEDAQQTNVLKSSSELFGVIKKSLTRCSKFVSRGAAMLELCKAFQRVLKAYAGRLVGRLPKTASGATTATATAHTTDWQIKLADEDVPVVCTIVSTAEYCVDVVGALGRNVAKMLDPPFGDQASLHEHRLQVDMSEEEDEFQAVITACLSVLLLGCETRLDAALAQMARMPWSTLEAVGDQSEFVNTASRVLAELGPRIGGILNDNHFRYFCDKLANSFTPRFYDYIFKCRKIGEAGSQQLLLDTQAIKGLLLELPAAGRTAGEDGASSAFSSWVHREMGRCEALLKVVGSRPDTVVDNFFTLMPQGAAADFQHIIDLKVMRRNEQQACIEAFNRRSGRGGAPSAAAGPVQVPRPPGAPTASATATAAALGPPQGSATGLGSAMDRGSIMSLPSLAPRSGLEEAALRPSTSTQELASRFKFGANTAAARASAATATATERMKESMAGSLAAMKNLNLGFKRPTAPDH